MITAIIVDDDSNIRSGIKTLLERYASDICILGEAATVDDAIRLIEKENPQVLFLDIQLAEGTGFDILEKINKTQRKIPFQVVFITAHEQYAIKAFRFSALDFLLKPIDPKELQQVVEKIRTTVQQRDSYENIELLLENIRKKTNSFNRIALSTAEGIHLFDIKNIIRCESEDNYTRFFINNEEKPLLISKTLKEYEELLSGHGFVRIHQSHLINLAYLQSYIKRDGGYVVMKDSSHLPISQRKKEYLQEILKSM